MFYDIKTKILRAAYNWALNHPDRAFHTSLNNNIRNQNYFQDKPVWVSLSEPEHFEAAYGENPIVNSTITLLASSASNGIKVAIDTKTKEEIPWSDKREGIQNAFKLLVQRPNPTQSAKEFHEQRVTYTKVYGNGYVYGSMPTGFDKELDIALINSLQNLPAQFTEVKTTGKVYDQTTIAGIISNYAVTDPKREFKPEQILHFNEVNVASQFASIMGVSKLKSLEKPITNVQLAFGAMNSMLADRGMQGIISSGRKDAMGGVPMQDHERDGINEATKGYGLQRNQTPFLLLPYAVDYHKTAMNSMEMGIYQEFSNNAIMICNAFKVPPELVKTYILGATYENQIQSVRRLYQDAVIPMVTDEDTFWSYRLNTFKYGFEIQTRWDHIPALGENKKEQATALSMNARTAEASYNNNIITMNDYLKLIDQKAITGGDVYKVDRDRKLKVGENGNEEN